MKRSNEELSTTNDELRSRNLQQNRDNSDLNNFIASINVPIVMLTNDLRIRRFTPSAQRLFNFISTDIGRPFTDLHGNFDVSQLEPMILEVLDTLNTKDQEIQTATGYWYNLRIRPYRTTENQIDGVTLVFLDVNVPKQYAATLEAARNYAETIIETVQIPLLVLDAEFRVHTVNRSFYETFCVAEVATLHTPLFELGNGQWDIPQLRSRLEQLLADGQPMQDFEVDHTFEQIGPKTILLNACKLQQEDDADMILLSIVDITERKQFETERSQLLAQEQAARAQAEAANRAKDEFLSNLSHELRTPLAALLAWARLLRAGTLDEDTAARALESIERNALSQNQLIEDILDVSRITSGKLRLNSRPIDVLPVVQAALNSVYLAAEARTIQLVPSLSSVVVMGDGDRLQQVLWNLLSNAIKFTPAGGRVEITLAQIGDQAQIQVRDTGQGIRTDQLAQVFERFYQVDSSTTKTNQGLGLGLTIVRHLVELHGGTVRAESAGEGQGTTFTVRLPLYTLPATEPPLDEPAIEPPPDRAPYLPSLNSLQILVVEDQVDVRVALQVILAGYGAEVLAVTTARAAIAALRENPGRYDVLIADIGLPEEDGYFLIQQVRSLSPEEGGQIPAIALTGYASETERQRAIAVGFQIHMAKPFDPIQLGAVVADLAKRS